MFVRLVKSFLGFTQIVASSPVNRQACCEQSSVIVRLLKNKAFFWFSCSRLSIVIFFRIILIAYVGTGITLIRNFTNRLTGQLLEGKYRRWSYQNISAFFCDMLRETIAAIKKQQSSQGRWHVNSPLQRYRVLQATPHYLSWVSLPRFSLAWRSNST